MEGVVVVDLMLFPGVERSVGGYDNWRGMTQCEWNDEQ